MGGGVDQALGLSWHGDHEPQGRFSILILLCRFQPASRRPGAAVAAFGPLLLRRHRVPFYWLISLEDRVLVADAPDGEDYRVVPTLKDVVRARVAPFEAIEVDLACVFGVG
jgi:hypothetical protein